MKIIIGNEDYISELISQDFIEVVNKKPNAVLGLATGTSPLKVYANMAKANKEGKVSFKDVTTFNLDEYVGLDGTHNQSYRYFMNENLFNFIDVDKARTNVLKGVGDYVTFMNNYDNMIANAGGIDIQILGIGSDGHIAFNEPGTSFDSLTHETELTEQTIKDNSRLFNDISEVPTRAVTMGLKSIMNAKKIVLIATGKKLVLICDRHKYTTEQIMYSTRNRLRSEFKKACPNEEKVFFYFPIDDNIRVEAALELLKLSYEKEPSACMFKFFVSEPTKQYSAATRPICSYQDIHPGDWGGYCAYTIHDEEKCPLYPSIAIPNVAFYAELYRAGYREYASKEICVDHLRHLDSHHFKTKDTTMSQKVRAFLMKQRENLYKDGYK